MCEQYLTLGNKLSLKNLICKIKPLCKFYFFVEKHFLEILASGENIDPPFIIT